MLVIVIIGLVGISIWIVVSLWTGASQKGLNSFDRKSSPFAFYVNIAMWITFVLCLTYSIVSYLIRNS